MINLITYDTLYTPSNIAFPNLYYSKQPFIKTNGKDTIYGYYEIGSEKIVFYSVDGLKSSTRHKIPYGWNILYFHNENIIIHRVIGGTSSWASFELMESSDFGETFIFKLTKDIVYQEYTYTPVFANVNEGLFLTQPFSNDFSNFDVYKITNKSFEKVSSIYQAINSLCFPKLLSFIDNENIFFVGYGVSFTEKPSYIFHSSDGGLTWQSKYIETMPPISNFGNNQYYHSKYLMVINKNKYIFYETKLYEGYIDLYYTYDAGVNWNKKEFNLKGFIYCIQFINEQVGYMLVKGSGSLQSRNSSVYKSIDSGESWEIVYENIYANKIYFADENNGIATFYGIVQITKDGGINWTVLTY